MVAQPTGASLDDAPDGLRRSLARAAPTESQPVRDCPQTAWLSHMGLLRRGARQGSERFGGAPGREMWL